MLTPEARSAHRASESDSNRPTRLNTPCDGDRPRSASRFAPGVRAIPRGLSRLVLRQLAQVEAVHLPIGEDADRSGQVGKQLLCVPLEEPRLGVWQGQLDRLDFHGVAQRLTRFIGSKQSERVFDRMNAVATNGVSIVQAKRSPSTSP